MGAEAAPWVAMRAHQAASYDSGCQVESRMPERTQAKGEVAAHQLPSFFQLLSEPPLWYWVYLDFELDQLEAEAVRAAAPRWGFSSHCFLVLG